MNFPVNGGITSLGFHLQKKDLGLLKDTCAVCVSLVLLFCLCDYTSVAVKL